jgi:polo-like kinase 1
MTQILEHDFFHMGSAIPKSLPTFTLACPPSENYIKQFMGNMTGDAKNGTQSAREAGQRPDNSSISNNRGGTRDEIETVENIDISL